MKDSAIFTVTTDDEQVREGFEKLLLNKPMPIMSGDIISLGEVIPEGKFMKFEVRMHT